MLLQKVSSIILANSKAAVMLSFVEKANPECIVGL